MGCHRAVRQCAVLQAALNGNRAPGSHRALPVMPPELVADGVSCVRVGAAALHIHPRSSSSGLETLDPAAVDETVAGVRAATGVPIGVSTGAWIEPDPTRRADLVSAWREPDMASVNLSEDGAELVAQALLEAGIGVEAGIWSVEDAERLCRQRPCRATAAHPRRDRPSERRPSQGCRGHRSSP